jgi:hypothetical protein
VFENRVPRRVFGPKRDEVTGEWRKLNNGELHNFFSSPGGRGLWHAWERGEKFVQCFDGKARREKTTWKTKALMGGWDQNGP